jgi:hypothetical protein
MLAEGVRRTRFLCVILFSCQEGHTDDNQTLEAVRRQALTLAGSKKRRAPMCLHLTPAPVASALSAILEGPIAGMWLQRVAI